MANKITEHEETQFPGLKDDNAPTDAPRPDTQVETPPVGRFAETPPKPIYVPERKIKAQTRRDFLIYGAGAAAVAAGWLWALPDSTRQRLGLIKQLPDSPDPTKDRLLNKALTFDDDVAKLLYTPGRPVPTFAPSLALPPAGDDEEDVVPGKFRVNYEGGRPEALYGNYVPHWKMRVTGLASGRAETLTQKDIQSLIARYGRHEQITRLVCVEGWSQIGQWAGLRFADFLAAYPPASGMRWAQLRSSYNVQTNSDTDADGNPTYSPDPYYVSIDMATALHPQSLLATEQSGKPLTIGHGAPLRLLVPMKLGLKNIKAITSIHYTAAEPADYWSSEGRGYSHYDGV